MSSNSTLDRNILSVTGTSVSKTNPVEEQKSTPGPSNSNVSRSYLIEKRECIPGPSNSDVFRPNPDEESETEYEFSRGSAPSLLNPNIATVDRKSLDKPETQREPSRRSSPSIPDRSSLGLVTPSDISPIPAKRAKPSNRGRKATMAAIITSSPYKNDLTETINKKTNRTETERTRKEATKQCKNKTESNKKGNLRKKKNKKTSTTDSDENKGDLGKKKNETTKNKVTGNGTTDSDEDQVTKKQGKNKTENKKKGSLRKRKNKETTDDLTDTDNDEVKFDTDSDPDVPIGQDSPDYPDAECMFCQQLFSGDTQGELWIKCLMCGLWAHNDCAGPEFDTWICDFCKQNIFLLFHNIGYQSSLIS